jgi:hypothetical protein
MRPHAAYRGTFVAIPAGVAALVRVERPWHEDCRRADLIGSERSSPWGRPCGVPGGALVTKRDRLLILPRMKVWGFQEASL